MSPDIRPPVHHPEAVLVTGGAGFIGSNLLLHLVPAYPEVSFVNLDALTYAGNLMNLREVEDASNYHFVKGDVADRALVQELFEKWKFTTVIHLAAESHVDRSILEPLQFIETNINGTAVLLEAARTAWNNIDDQPDRYRFYHISTDEVYGSLGETGYFDEDTPYDPHSPYSASKAGADHLVRAYGTTYDMPVIISNCTNNYGPYQFPEKLIPLVIRNAVNEDEIPVYGTGENIRDWLHVYDHCQAIEQILRRGRTQETYAVGGRAERSNLELVQTIVDLVDKALGRESGSSRSLITFVEDRPGHDFRYAMDCSKLENELGWSREYSLEKGLRETVSWYLEHQDWVEAVLDDSYQTYYQQQYASRTSQT